MNKTSFISAILLFFIFLIAVTGCNSENTELNTYSLKVGINPDYPPFEFHQEGKLMGFDVDLMQAIGKELGMAIQFQEMAFPSLMGALQTKKIDAAISSMTISPERQKSVNFSIPYYKSTLAILYLKDKSLPNIHLLSNSKIGVQLGSTMEKWLKNNIKGATNVKMITLDTNGPLIEKLKLDQIDYLVIEMLQAIEFSKVNPSLAYINIGIDPDGYGIAIAKDSLMVEKINHAIYQLQQNGTLKKLEQKWLGKN